MRILFIAPLPPPVTGHSLVSKVLLDDLEKNHEVITINTNKSSSKEGVDSLQRIFTVVKILINICKSNRNADTIYLTISESLAGNLKDLCIYLACYRNLSKMYIHLHGGSIKKLLWDRHKFIFILNKLFIRKLAGVLISGQSHMNIFKGLISDSQIHTVSNFAQDQLFRNKQEIVDKFTNIKQFVILFMSSLREKKGYNDLADAYIGLGNEFKEQIKVDFVGRFESVIKKKMFLDKIAKFDNIHYHGTVNDNAKKTLFSCAHIFCLPTSYLEGQPISILEAYSSGCVVLTTGQDGILDIFTDGLNGFLIHDRSAKSIRATIEYVIQNKEKLIPIAIYNRNIAGKYHKADIYNSTIRNIIES